MYSSLLFEQLLLLPIRKTFQVDLHKNIFQSLVTNNSQNPNEGDTNSLCEWDRPPPTSKRKGRNEKKGKEKKEEEQDGWINQDFRIQ